VDHDIIFSILHPPSLSPDLDERQAIVDFSWIADSVQGYVWGNRFYFQLMLEHWCELDLGSFRTTHSDSFHPKVDFAQFKIVPLNRSAGYFRRLIFGGVKPRKDLRRGVLVGHLTRS
jgi:hypothetical protein